MKFKMLSLQELGQSRSRVKYSCHFLFLLLGIASFCNGVERGMVMVGNREYDVRGALVEDLGNVMIIQQSLEIHLEFKDMILFQDTVAKIRSHLEQELNNFQDINPKVGEINRLLRSLSPNASNDGRHKRSLLPFVGGIISNLFGTAAETNVNNLESKIKRLEAWSSNNNVVIKNVARCIQKLKGVMHDIELLLEKRLAKLNEKIESMKLETETHLFFDDLYDLLFLWYTELSNFSRDLILA